MKFISAFLLLLSLLSAVPLLQASAFTEKDVERSLRQLDYVMRRRDEFKQRRVRHLDSLKTARNRVARVDSIGWLERTMEIAKGYTSFNNDSALLYFTDGYNMARDVASRHPGSPVGNTADSLGMEFRMRRATYLSVSGFVNDALNEYNGMDTTRMGSVLLANYYEAGRQMYSFISFFYDGYLSTYDYWNNRSIEAQRKLLPLLQPNTDKYLLNLGEYYYNIRE